MCVVPAAVRRRAHGLLGHPDPAHPQDHDGDHDRHPRAPGARRRAGGRRRRSARSSTSTPRSCCASRSPSSSARRCAGTRSAARTRMATDPGPRADPGHRAGRRRRRQASPPCACNLLADMGAYLQLVTPGIPLLGAFLYPGVYDVPGLLLHVHVRVHERTPTDAYRGAGRPEATYAIERAMDALARKVGIDPIEIRRRNFIPTDKFPYAVGGRAGVRLRRLRAGARRARSSWSATTTLRAEQAQRRADGDHEAPRHRHLDATSRCAASRRAGCWRRSTTRPAAGRRRRCGCCRPARCRSSPAPRRTARATRRAWSMIVADKLGVSPDDVEVLHSDTAIARSGSTPTARARWRSAASRSTWPPTR